jgi:hypothetical protein
MEEEMPFTKIGRNTYTSPAGNKFTRSQMALYYARGGRFPGQGMRESFPNPGINKMSAGPVPNVGGGSASANPFSPIPTRAGGQSFRSLKLKGL